MAILPWPRDEIERLAELHALGALEEVPDPDFSAIAAAAAEICQTPIGLVNLIGRTRQYFKGHAGIAAAGMDRQMAFCPYTICARQLMEIPDALADPRFRDDPAVLGEPYARFYAGAPVISAAGHALGTVCVMAPTPRRLSATQRRILATLATGTAALLAAQHRGEALERLRQLSMREVHLLQRVTGELHAPLTTLRAYLQVIADGEMNAALAEQLAKALARAHEPLAELIDELVLLAGLHRHLAVIVDPPSTPAGRPEKGPA
ncbi:GAF domain-containing protein [Planobispora rosea]|uniref:GAF domain-containing protein n=1 Tax=Planobispora rosea TaxID=35762 RepID=UPI00083AF330|nr:GAF domain-containing protein [Planobispora rosea]